MYSNRLAICIASHDSYSDILEVYLQCFKKFWIDSPYELIIATNKKKYFGFKVLNSGVLDDTMTARLLLTLNATTTKYVLLMCDDTIMTSELDCNRIEKILNDMDAYNLNFCGFMNHLNGKPLYKGSQLLRVKRNKAYAKNLQCGIYNRQFLISELGDGQKSGWDIEAKWMAEAADSPSEFSKDIVSYKGDVISCIHCVAKGKWYQGAIDKLNNIGIEVRTERETISLVSQHFTEIYAKTGKLMTPKMRKIIKGALSKIGFKFTVKD